MIGLLFYAFRPVIKSDEIYEVLLAVAFASYAQTVFFDSMNRFSASTAGIFQRKLALFFTIFVLTGFFVSVFGVTISRRIEGLKGQLHSIAAAGYPEAKLYRQAEELFERILAREYLMRKHTLMQYGILLVQGNNPKADGVLKQALQKESEKEIKNPEEPEYNRSKGIIYKLLEMDAEANAEFEVSIQKGRAQLEKIYEDSEKYKLALSMAETFIAMENYDLAREHLNEAMTLIPGAREKGTVQHWMKRIGDKSTITRSQYLQMLQYIYL